MNQFASRHSIDEMIEHNVAANERLLATASELSDEQMREPSLLPGWTKGHVLTHVARSGDGLRNLFVWAETGVETPQYPSLESRAADIEAGAGRSAAEIVADLASAADAFVEHARKLPDEAWLTEVRAIRGSAQPAWFVLGRRLFEVEVHHADLGLAYGPVNWPGWFVTAEMYRVTSELAQNPEAPSAVLNDALSGRQFFLRTDDASDTAITGAGYALLAWLIGRQSDSDLAVDPEGSLPDIPSYG